MYGVKRQNTRRFALVLMLVSGFIDEPESVMSVVQAIDHLASLVARGS